MSDTLADLSQQMLDFARAAGAQEADVLALRGTSASVDVRAGAVEHIERAEGVDLGLRVLIGGRQASISASDVRPESLRAMAERAVAMARLAPEDPHAGLAAAAELAQQTDSHALELFDPAPEPSPEALEHDARAAEAAALAVKGVTQVQGASGAYSARDIHIAASNGFSAGYRRTDRMISCAAISGEGATMERDGHGEARVFQDALPDPAEIGQIAGQRAAERAGATRAKTGAVPVVFDERISSTLISHLLAAANGGAVARGASWLRAAMGEQVLPKGLSLMTEPHRPRIGSSRLFDAEGLATSPLALVDDGALRHWVLDLATARKLGMQSNAHAARGTGGAPSPASGNVALTPGTTDRAGLLAQMGTGLLVTGLIGATINPNTGDYSRGASGFWVENGEITHPVSEITIAGNLREMLSTIVPANDARPHLARRVPSLLVEGLTLAGA